MSTLDLKIVTPDGVQFSQEVESATIPTSSGQITVLPKHSPLVSELKQGKLLVRTGNKVDEFDITSGVLEVRRSGAVIILTDSV
ncbi:MAG: ATP synthase F1 subunit epsilon [Candidatus Harrisonbacteria bacterium CG10_big_fil_rev_8_21_14_0_10_49_15]|uniref:ATP synthase F1 subunit epsilon n=1 Tax=Candidatus Harrisonbacteria bacterium CG10_big_fil_rev_8_21_14_0_10_49_15 TaxID=1974587 RepID=A0A2H0UKQ7_9BACT|nr:MAG: ATP synthase F1 subunit epsilon [Candidatus Harrisonbacteria bacterium CG10_big_fil_rev_8_21_14_0_10_49_15]